MTGRTERGRAVVVVGSEGFIGGAFARRLRREWRPMFGIRSRAELQTTAARRVLRNADVVFYLAGSLSPVLAAQRPDLVRRETDSLDYCLEVCGGGRRRPRLVFASSGGTIYSSQRPPPYREGDEVAPSNRYGEMKLAMEARILGSEYVTPQIVRLSNVYGPGQHARRGVGVISHWLEAISRGESLALFGDPRSTRDYVFIDDVVSALLRFIDVPGSLPGVINIGSGQATELSTLARTVSECTGGGELNISRRGARRSDRSRVWLEVELARQVLDWSPQTELAAGIETTWRLGFSESRRFLTLPPSPGRGSFAPGRAVF